MVLLLPTSVGRSPRAQPKARSTASSAVLYLVASSEPPRELSVPSVARWALQRSSANGVRRRLKKNSTLLASKVGASTAVSVLSLQPRTPSWRNRALRHWLVNLGSKRRDRLISRVQRSPVPLPTSTPM